MKCDEHRINTLLALLSSLEKSIFWGCKVHRLGLAIKYGRYIKTSFSDLSDFDTVKIISNLSLKTSTLLENTDFSVELYEYSGGGYDCDLD